MATQDITYSEREYYLDFNFEITLPQ